MFISRVNVGPDAPLFTRGRNGVREHQFVMSLFPDGLDDKSPRSAINALWRLDATKMGELKVTIKSDILPSLDNVKSDRMRNAVSLESKEFDGFARAIALGDVSYSVRLNSIKRSDNGERPLRNLDEIAAWWKDKAAGCGLSIDESKLDIAVESALERTKDSLLASTQISGRGTVTDAEKLDSAVRDGVGRGKNYGFGLLLIGG